MWVCVVHIYLGGLSLNPKPYTLNLEALALRSDAEIGEAVRLNLVALGLVQPLARHAVCVCVCVCTCVRVCVCACV